MLNYQTIFKTAYNRLNITKTWKPLKSNTFYTADNGSGTGIGASIVIASDEWINFNDPEMDVTGLPIWSKKNVGATNGSTPESWYGDYFQWGGTDPVTSTIIDVGWSNCPGNGGSSDRNPSALDEWNATNLTDGMLKSEVDAATHNCGGKWRMPTGGTAGEWKQLKDNTYWAWTSDYKGISGLNGYVVFKVKNVGDKGKTSDPTESYSVNSDSHLFLPAAGIREGNSVNAHGSYGSYWSSSCGDSGYAYYISSCNSDIILDNGYYRYGGLSVRPVL